MNASNPSNFCRRSGAWMSATVAAAALMVGGAALQEAEAAVVLTDAGGMESNLYTQDFNGIPNGADGTTATWTDNSTVPGWYARLGADTPATFRRSAGGVNAYNTLFSFGAASNTDRALGAIAGSLSALRPAQTGAAFTNDTGLTISELIIGYTAEQWRRSEFHFMQSFEYSLDATSLFTGTWTSVAALNGQTLHIGANGALDGNNAANRTVIAPVTIAGLDIADGASFWIRWTNGFNADNRGHLGIDDFSLKATLVPEPASLMLLAAGSLLVGLRRRGRKVTA